MSIQTIFRDATKAIDRSAHRFTRPEVREAIGWSDYQVRMHLTRLVQLEYVLPHRGSRGQQFVYELLYDGQDREGHPFLMGLIDPARLSPDGMGTPAANAGDQYDAKVEGVGADLEARGEQDEPPKSTQSGLEEASLRPSSLIASPLTPTPNSDGISQPG